MFVLNILYKNNVLYYISASSYVVTLNRAFSLYWNIRFRLGFELDNALLNRIAHISGLFWFVFRSTNINIAAFPGDRVRIEPVHKSASVFVRFHFNQTRVFTVWRWSWHICCLFASISLACASNSVVCHRSKKSSTLYEEIVFFWTLVWSIDLSLMIGLKGWFFMLGFLWKFICFIDNYNVWFTIIE